MCETDFISKGKESVFPFNTLAQICSWTSESAFGHEGFHDVFRGVLQLAALYWFGQFVILFVGGKR